MKLDDRHRHRLDLDGVFASFMSLMQHRDHYTATHMNRVASLSHAIAIGLRMDKGDALGVFASALLHDIGKVALPMEILSLPRELSASEFEIVKTHSLVGHTILLSIDFPWPVAKDVLCHHERCDGSGYPNGLAASSIPIGARIIGVADTVDAMTSHRPYRPGLGLNTALQEISRGRATVYDPEVVDACLAVLDSNSEMLKILEGLQGIPTSRSKAPSPAFADAVVGRGTSEFRDFI